MNHAINETASGYDQQEKLRRNRKYKYRVRKTDRDIYRVRFYKY